MSTQENIILDKYLRIGDRVVMNMDNEARGWGRKGVPDGTTGTVIGFHRYETYVPRIGGWGKKPGLYMGNGAAVVAWDTGEHDTPGASDLYWAENSDALKDTRQGDAAWNEAFETKQFIRDLPDLPFWEQDIVRDRTGRVRMDEGDTGMLRIRRIQYYNLDQRRDDGSPMPIYEVGAVDRNSGTMSVDEACLDLVERGRVWTYFNDRSNLKFESLEEEAGFFHALGHTDEVRNPRSGNYSWASHRDIGHGLLTGVIDVVQTHAGFFGAGPSAHGYRFHDRDLGERVRAKSLRGGWPRG